MILTAITKCLVIAVLTVNLINAIKKGSKKHEQK
jgi:hypothetical protein